MNVSNSIPAIMTSQVTESGREKLLGGFEDRFYLDGGVNFYRTSDLVSSSILEKNVGKNANEHF